MTYLDYFILFQKLDQEQMFSAGTTHLYLKLLDLANAEDWPCEFAKSDPWLAELRDCSINPKKTRRAELVSRGQLEFEPSGTRRGAAAIYRLLAGEKVLESAVSDGTK